MKTLSFGLILWLCSSYLYAQTPPYTLPANPTNLNIIPPAPEAWAFTKYGDYPVSRETGVPNISIPLHNIVVDQLSVPISLTYHASGIKVNERASWVGLGWDINVGGVVSRTVRGYPDELPEGYLIHGIPLSTDFTPCDNVKYETLNKIIAGEYDAEPDEFSYSLPGSSGKFFLTPQGRPITQPFSDDSIEFVIQGYHIREFTIRTPNGVKYRFAEAAQTVYHTNYSLWALTANTSWYLTEIITPNSTETIRFFYKQKADEEPYYNRDTQTSYLTFKYEPNWPMGSGLYQGYSLETKDGGIDWTFSLSRAIERIEYSGGKVIFNSASGRQDALNQISLNSIDIYGADLTTVTKGFNFTYGYFTGAGGGATPEDLRLKLISLQERGKNNEVNPPHSFTYLETGAYQLPPRFSFSQDHWGYYNAKVNSSLIPNFDFYDPLIVGLPIKMGTADRNPDIWKQSMKAGMLKSIHYPTKGKTEFDFEANEFRRSYSQEITTPSSYEVTIYPAGGGGNQVTEVIKYIPEVGTMTATKSVVVTYRIMETLGTLNPGDLSVGLEDITAGSTLVGQATVTGFVLNKSVTLEANHRYRIYVRSTNMNWSQNQGVAYIRVYWEDKTYQNVTENTVVGGVRIRSIKNFDDNGTLQTQKHYRYYLPTDTTLSSGNYNSNYIPTANSYLSRKEMRYSANNSGSFGKNVVISLTSSPAHQHGFSASNPVTYEYVTEFSEKPLTATLGKSVYQYALAADYLLPFVTSSNLDRSWQRGQLIKESHFNNSGGIVKDVTYDYETMSTVYPDLTGLKVAKSWDHAPEDACVGFESCNDALIIARRYSMFIFTTYSQIFQWKRLKTITENLSGVQNITQLSYNSSNQHSNVVKAEITGSDNKVGKTELKYAHESASTDLINRNMIGIPLESNQYTAMQLTGGSRLSYGFFESLFVPKKYEQRFSDLTYADVGEITIVNHKGYPVVRKFKDGTSKITLWNRAGDKPLADILSPVTPSEIAAASVLNPTYSTVPPGDMLRQDFVITHSQSVTMSTTIQDPGGVMINTGIYAFCIVREGETTERYTHNVAGTKNQTITLPAGRYYLKSRLSLGAIQNIITQVNLQFQTKSLDFFYNGFEEGEGNSTSGDCKTGVKSITNNYYKTLTGLVDGKNYVLSYWQKVAGVWTLQQSVVTSSGGSYNISITGQVDEVRFYPQGCHMTTLAYDPLDPNLVITMTDTNSLPSHHEYDAFGRLKAVRDGAGNIVKSNEYYYKN